MGVRRCMRAVGVRAQDCRAGHWRGIGLWGRGKGTDGRSERMFLRLDGSVKIIEAPTPFQFSMGALEMRGTRNIFSGGLRHKPINFFTRGAFGALIISLVYIPGFLRVRFGVWDVDAGANPPIHSTSTSTDNSLPSAISGRQWQWQAGIEVEYHPP